MGQADSDQWTSEVGALFLCVSIKWGLELWPRGAVGGARGGDGKRNSVITFTIDQMNNDFYLSIKYKSVCVGE